MITKKKLSKFIKKTTDEIIEELKACDIPENVTAGECPDLMFYCGELATLVNLGVYFNLYSTKQIKELKEFLKSCGYGLE